MNRVSLINLFISDRGFKSYLELGVYDKSTFNSISCNDKFSVDFKFDANFKGTTDDFFSINKDKYDIIFIDANHTEPFLSRDIQNSLSILNKDGVVVCHDVNPPSEFHQADENNLYQTAWKAFVKYRFSGRHFTYSYPSDCGLGVIDTSLERNVELLGAEHLNGLSYQDLDKNRAHLLGFK